MGPPVLADGAASYRVGVDPGLDSDRFPDPGPAYRVLGIDPTSDTERHNPIATN